MPTYFDGTFQILHPFMRIKGKHEIDLMAASCVDYISKNSDKLHYPFFFEKYYQCFHITECGLSPSALDVKFNTFGMQKLTNCDTAVALCIALFSKIIMRTSKRGQYMLDFDGLITAVNRKGCEYVGHEMRKSPYDDLFDICLKPFVRAVKIYKE